VQTYIQSGNVVFQSSENSKELENKIQNRIQLHFGFEVCVLVLTYQELKRIFDDSPFAEDKKKASYFMMLHDCPSDELVKEASEKVYEGEEYRIINDCIYYYFEKGLGKAKFNVNFFERKFKTFATARNYNTMVKLLALSFKIVKDQ
jgi:uncharacterized protein (DUF1697 family)